MWKNEKLMKYAEMAKWKPETSTVVGYFPDKMMGYRCIWTCRWITSHGLVTLADMDMELENMPLEYVMAEIEDLGNQGYEFAKNILHSGYVEKYFQIVNGVSFANDLQWKDTIEKWWITNKDPVFRHLNHFRLGYMDFQALWDYKKSSQTYRLRPSW